MTAQTRVSAKGQVVIPKEVRDRLAWSPGTALDVIMGANGGVTLRRTKPTKDQDVEAAFAKLRATVSYDGPPGNDDDWNAAIASMFAAGGDDR